MLVISTNLFVIVYQLCSQILEAQDEVAEKTQIYLPYNILPLDPDSADQAIMRYPEVSFLYILYLLTYNLAVSLLSLEHIRFLC
jgi:hypothetical protein